VRENLWHFLSQMKMEKVDSLFGIDALSINQNDLLGKNHQVQIMGKIYAKVCVISFFYWPSLAIHSGLYMYDAL
jgi:hypothetical protein